ncbi:MAG: DSD1 family PLP-dependent enzyme [Pirellulales bacterium]
MTLAAATSLIGHKLEDLDTPALCLDLEALDANIARMAAHTRAHQVDWRPHAKAHKCPQIAQRQVAAGAIGITCAKLGEAEVFAAAGVRDILIANQIVGPHKMTRLRALRAIADPIVCVDSADHVAALSRAFAETAEPLRVLIEINVGLNRAGTAAGEPVVELARQIVASPGLHLAGIMGYEGHLLNIPDVDEKRDRIRSALAVLPETKGLLERSGIDCEIVSAGGTGSYEITPICPGVTEVQAGGLVLMDAYYKNRCGVSGFQHALLVLTGVVSRPAPDRAVIDAGRKCVHGDLHKPLVVGRDDIEVARLTAEHGDLTLAESARDLQIGDRLLLVPGYSDFTCVLHDEFVVLRGGVVEAVWPLAARGKLK